VVNVDSFVRLVRASSLQFDPVHDTLIQTLLYRNSSDTLILTSPFTLIFGGLPRGVRLANRLGYARSAVPLGAPYLRFVTPHKILRPGESVKIQLIFRLFPQRAQEYQQGLFQFRYFAGVFEGPGKP
jgi:hypothetical protein